MNDLTDFLLARTAEDEERAQTRMKRAQETQRILQDPWYLGRSVPGWHDWPDVEADAARILARCAADRRIVESEIRREVGPVSHYVSSEVHAQIAARTATPVMRLLALPYADHADYDEAWRP